jgi:hypothetical protein
MYTQSPTSHAAQTGAALVVRVNEFLKENIMALVSHKLHVLHFALLKKASGMFRLS